MLSNLPAFQDLNGIKLIMWMNLSKESPGPQNIALLVNHLSDSKEKFHYREEEGVRIADQRKEIFDEFEDWI